MDGEEDSFSDDAVAATPDPMAAVHTLPVGGVARVLVGGAGLASGGTEPPDEFLAARCKYDDTPGFEVAFAPNVWEKPTLSE